MRERYVTGWTDPRVPRFESEYVHQVRYTCGLDGKTKRGYTVVKYNLTRPEAEQVLAQGLTLDEANGFLKLLKEEDDG